VRWIRIWSDFKFPTGSRNVAYSASAMSRSRSGNLLGRTVSYFCNPLAPPSVFVTAQPCCGCWLQAGCGARSGAREASRQTSNDSAAQRINSATLSLASAIVVMRTELHWAACSVPATDVWLRTVAALQGSTEWIVTGRQLIRRGELWAVTNQLIKVYLKQTCL